MKNESWQTLERHACVGNAVFSPGVPARLVIEAACHHYEARQKKGFHMSHEPDEGMAELCKEIADECNKNSSPGILPEDAEFIVRRFFEKTAERNREKLKRWLSGATGEAGQA
ncbi:MAG: hypothetical protein LBU76_00445 [Azoarcus sp.]|jgi:hypothetical protein|nr:hypothetical protein [Azoarcus sp.]